MYIVRALVAVLIALVALALAFVAQARPVGLINDHDHARPVHVDMHSLPNHRVLVSPAAAAAAASLPVSSSSAMVPSPAATPRSSTTTTRTTNVPPVATAQAQSPWWISLLLTPAHAPRVTMRGFARHGLPGRAWARGSGYGMRVARHGQVNAQHAQTQTHPQQSHVQSQQGHSHVFQHAPHNEVPAATFEAVVARRRRARTGDRLPPSFEMTELAARRQREKREHGFSVTATAMEELDVGEDIDEGAEAM